MATTVSHAMRRYSATPHDTKYTNFSPLRSEDNPSGVWRSPEESSGVGGGGGGSALSRSMRYAEPWLYGSVRGAPVLLAAALPLCGCAEYVHGTANRNKSGKNKTSQPSQCKKCKGTRLPLQQGTVRAKYGTVRGYPTSAPPPALTSVRAGTVRVSSSSRPSILPSSPAIDPYDLMRRSRLSCSDVGSQFRARSTSPNKNRNLDSRNYSGKSKRSPSPVQNVHHGGRKSILECDVNPYELMSTDGKEKKLTNGQRGFELVSSDGKDRKKGYESMEKKEKNGWGGKESVREKTINGKWKHLDSEYEDIEIPPMKKTQSHIPKLQFQQRLQKKTSSVRKPNEREIRNEAKFKSILKKPSATFNDTDSVAVDCTNTSASYKSGSHFYLPMPTQNPPRKKVQFLVESELVQEENNDRKDIDQKETHACQNNFTATGEGTRDLDIATIESESFVNDAIEYEEEGFDEGPCRLKRSLSERLGHGPPPISFNDTMALRTPRGREALTDAAKVSTLFDAVTDLQRLDGIGPSRPRPKEPPPPPPPPSQNPETEILPPLPERERRPTPPPKSTTELESGYEVTTVEDTAIILASTERLLLQKMEEILYEKNDLNQNYNFEEEKEKRRDDAAKNNLDEVMLNGDSRYLMDIEEKKTGDDKKLKDVETKHDVAQKESKKNDNLPDNKNLPNDTPPSAPPRKRSNSKQPITSQIITKKENTNKTETSPVTSTKSNDNVINQNIILDLSIKDEFTTDHLPKSSTNDSIADVISENNSNSEPSPKEILNKTIFESPKVFEKETPQFETPIITIKSVPSTPNENISSTRIESSDYSYQKVKIEPSKTIVQINSPTVQVIPSTVHRLQIKNEFEENLNVNKVSVSENPQRKTSIMINGDDCYSTVNVNDDIPIYQSSVVVNDYDSSKIEVSSLNRSSSVYITGDFQSPLTTRSKNEDRPNKTLVILEGTSSPSTPSPTIVQSPETGTGKTFVVLQQESIENVPRREKNVETVTLRRQNGDVEVVTPQREKQHVEIVTPRREKQDVEVVIPRREKRREKTVENEIEKKNELNRHKDVDIKPSSEELQRLLKDPVEAVKRNLVPHVCGKADVERKSRNKKPLHSNSLVARLLEDPFLGSLAEGLETDTVAKLIEDSLMKLRSQDFQDDDKDCSENESCPPYEMMEAGSDCYSNHSNRSSVTEDELGTRSKFYQLLADAALSEVEEHHYECIRQNVDPIYEEIEIPPPLPSNPPPSSIVDDLQIDKQFTTRSIFEGASKYDILSYLVDAKERGIVPEETYTYNFSNSGDVIVEEEEESKRSVFSSRVSHMSTVSDSSEDSSLVITAEKSPQKSAEVERNDSGVGSETSKCSRSRYLSQPEASIACEDCDLPVDPQPEDGPLICRKCSKKRSERKEIITEIVETEEKYSRDLQIILEEFYQPMLVAGLLTPEQLSAIFLNVEELLENSQALAERLRDTLEIAIEQGDEDLLTVNIGKIILEAAPMLHAFESYCVRQGAASLLLASLEKDKELLRIFLRVSQMENTVLRRMNLNSFLMVPVQRVTKYPLLLARLHKVTPLHHDSKDLLREAQHKIELHLSHMNSETKDVPSKLWRRISSGSGRRSSSEMDLVNIKLRKIAVDVLEWNHDEARFALEGRLLYTQPTDNNWRKGRTIKLTPVNALLVTNGKPNASTKPERSPTVDEGALAFPRHTGVREAALLLVRDKGGRYSLLREPLYLDRCVIATDPAWQSYFEVQELLGKDTFIFKAEDAEITRTWYRQLQYHAQGMGAWRKRRNALANIMINGMGSRT